MRLVAVELQMAPISNAIHIPGDIVKAAKEGKADAFEPLNERIQGMFQKLLSWGNALKAARS